jgi:hypothetical protein
MASYKGQAGLKRTQLAASSTAGGRLVTGKAIVATYERAGYVKFGSFDMETPSETELARRKRLKEKK